MKKTLIIFFLAFTYFIHPAYAADLLQVYLTAQTNDPLFQQSIADTLATKEGVPISVAAILPNLSLTASPSISRIGYSGTSYITSSPTIGGSIFPRNVTQRAYTLNLMVTQTIFDFSKFSAISRQAELSKAASAKLNASLQDLMTRVANAYFNVLKDEENLSYAKASKRAFDEQLHQIRQQYKVGLKTLTDVYTAQASFDTSTAALINAETQLLDDRENLRVIAGVYYPHLARLSEKFPLISPKPLDMNAWVRTAIRQNWSIKNQWYLTSAEREAIRIQTARHLPTVSLEALAGRQYTDSINRYNTLNNRNGPGTISEREVALNINVPIFSGGAIVASVNQARYNYDASEQQLEFIIRTTVNTTRQSYLNLVAGISQLKADRERIKSTISSLHGLETSYKVGTETLVNVLDQQQKVYEAQTQYAKDRYNFVNNILLLKKAAGTLSFEDLKAINAWLLE